MAIRVDTLKDANKVIKKLESMGNEISEYNKNYIYDHIDDCTLYIWVENDVLKVDHISPHTKVEVDADVFLGSKKDLVLTADIINRIRDVIGD